MTSVMTAFRKTIKRSECCTTVLLALLLLPIPMQRAGAQDQEDPPTRAARLAYMEGSVSFEPAGESDWVQAGLNRPMTTGDKIWADKESRAELQVGSARIDLSSNTGVSFLNLDDRTAQIELSSGALNIHVRHLNRDDVFEIDTPNQAFSIFQPGRYRVEASEDGTYTVVSIREGEGESTGNGQTYTVHAGQRATFEGTNTLSAQVENLGAPDDFDTWSYGRYDRYDNARSARYVSRDVVGYEDLDDYGDWRPDSNYGDVWFPRVSGDWAPYREGHWAWIDPWGWTWVDEDPWGYAPFHYGRWLSIEGRWGWVPGPSNVEPVYAPALVAFVGGGFGVGVAWFPLGPREVFVPSYGVSRDYVNRVNISNTTVNTTTITNVYNTTIVNNNTTIHNVSYVNRNVAGAVTAVPQQAFASAQPVARAAVRVTPQQAASAQVVSRAAVIPTSNSVLGSHAATANRVTKPPAALATRQVIAKATVPPAPVSFAARQQTLAAHPGQPVARQQLQNSPSSTVAAARPPVKQAPPGKPAMPVAVRPSSSQPANAPSGQPANRPGNPPAANQPNPNTPPRPQPEPSNRPAEPPARTDRPPSAQPNNRPEAPQPQPNNRPETNRPQPAPSNRPVEQPNNRPEAPQPQQKRPEPTPPQPNSRPDANRPQPEQPANRPAEPQQRTDRPPSAQPSNRPEPPQPQQNRPEANRSPVSQPAPSNRTAEPNNRPPEKQPPKQSETAPRPATPPASQRQAPPAQTRPAPKQQPRPLTPEEKKKKKEEQQQQEEKPHTT